VIGLVPLSLALILASNLVIAQALIDIRAWIVTAIVTVLIAFFWWLNPYSCQVIDS